MDWDSIVVKKTEELPKNSWQLGYFLSPHKGRDGESWARNLHELRVRDLALFALGDVKGRKVLEIGCGNGIYLDILARMGAQVSGQDISAEYVKDALANLKENKIEADIKVGDAGKLLFDDNYFDAVFAADFLEHVTHGQKNKIFSEVFRVLKPGGALVIKTPNLDYLKMTLLMKRIVALFKLKSPFNIYIEHTHNNPDSQHCGLISFAELDKLLFRNMFHAAEMIYLPLERKKIPKIIQKFLFGKKRFTDHLVVRARKPLFYGFLG